MVLISEQNISDNQIVNRLAAVNETYQQLLTDINAYHQSHGELTVIVECRDDGIREARPNFVVWLCASHKCPVARRNSRNDLISVKVAVGCSAESSMPQAFNNHASWYDK